MVFKMYAQTFNKILSIRNFRSRKPILLFCKMDTVQQDKIIMRPFEYIYNVPSKYHKMIGLAFNYWLQVSEKKVKEIDNILLIVHTASLLLDDIQDNSKLRYGVPAAHRLHGLGLTMNSVSNAFAIALQKVMELGHPMALNIYLKALLDGHRGQGIELYWRDNYICPTEEEYIGMLTQKSSVLIILTVELLHLFSKRKEKETFIRIALLLGVYYSIRDDYCNLFNQEALKILSEKNYVEVSGEHIPDNDITDGKFTLPIIHALKFPDHAEQILDILQQRTCDPEVICFFTSLLKKLDCDKYTEDTLRRLEYDIHDEINHLGGNPILTSIMHELGNWRRNEE